MALIPSNMLPLGTEAPLFNLIDAVSNNTKSLQDVQGEKATVIMFICNHCPYVKHLNEGIADLAKTYQTKGVGFIAISSNDVANYPDDSPAKLKGQAEEFGFNFAYLYDESQEVAKLYDAACTPDFYVFDEAMKLAYRGQFDDSRPGNSEAVTGKDIRRAIDALLAGEKVDEKQTPSIGCNIKWKAA